MFQLSDEELVSRYVSSSGDSEGEACVNELFQRHYRRVSLWCLRILGDRDRAADAAQEAFASAYQHLASFRGNSKFTTWLYTIARNQCLNEIRARGQREEEISEPLLAVVADSGPDPGAQFENRDSVSRLRRMIDEELDETERRVISLHYLEELPLEAVTRLLGLANPSGAKAFIVSARRKLQEAARRISAVNRRKNG